MEKQLIKKWIAACDILIVSYKADTVIPCPLCDITICCNCLWPEFEKKYCLEIGGLESELSDRIKRLRRWKRKLNKMLKDGGK